jgi:uncharacterized membrane protein
MLPKPQTHQTPSSPSTTYIVDRNIEALLARRAEEEKQLGWQERLAATITAFAGTMTFVWIHALIFGAWIVTNLVPGLPHFDPSLVILAMAASVEAIFLSTFILITQNRMQAQADRRADLALQINLLSEHEITRLVQMVSEIGDRLGSETAKRSDLKDLKQDVKPEDVLDALDRA